jgi:hypothetical protein
MKPPSALHFVGGPLDGELREVQRDVYGALPSRVRCPVLTPGLQHGPDVSFRDVWYTLGRLKTGGAVYVCTEAV